MRLKSRSFLVVFLTHVIFSAALVALSSDGYALELVNVTPLFQLKEGGGEPLHLPSDVVVGQDGRIYVLDGVNGRVVVYDAKGKFLFDFGTRGRGEGQLWDALGLDVHPTNGNIYIADSKNHRIDVFSAEGKFLFMFELVPNKEENLLADPTDVVLKPPKVARDIFTIITDKRTKCYIVDNNNHRLLIYDENGNYIQTLGFMGFEEEQLRFPYAVELDEERNIYISEVSNTRVQLLNEDFEFIRNIGTWGVRKGQLFRPQGLAIDPNRNVYVSDSYINVVQVFKDDGDFLGAIGINDKLQKFAVPVGLYVKDKKLYIVEMWGNTVSVFKLADYPK